MKRTENLSPRILIVDDDPLVRQTLRDLLADQGFATFGVSNGTAAIHACTTQPISLILLDFGLSPAMNGLETLKTLRKNHPDVKVIIITGCPHPVLLGMAQQLNAHQCLIKPIDPDLLLQSIRQELNSTRLA